VGCAGLEISAVGTLNRPDRPARPGGASDCAAARDHAASDGPLLTIVTHRKCLPAEAIPDRPLNEAPAQQTKNPDQMDLTGEIEEGHVASRVTNLFGELGWAAQGSEAVEIFGRFDVV
jgi:hypothetical protein